MSNAVNYYQRLALAGESARDAIALHIYNFAEAELVIGADQCATHAALTEAYRAFRGEAISDAVARGHVYALIDLLGVRRSGDQFVGIGLKP